MLKAAVVGVGYLGKFHAEKYARSKQAELVAVVDKDPEVAAKLAAKYRARACVDYKDLPGLGVNCVSVASTTSSHHEIASWLIDHGIDVLVEKPVAVTSDEARDLISRAETQGVILQVGHLERFNPAFTAMKAVLDRPVFFEVRRIAEFKGRGHDVDVVRDLMIHDIDIVSHLVGRPVERIDAVGAAVLTSSVDIANARLWFEGGAIANVTASRAAFKTERTIRVFQPNVYVSLDFVKKRIKICRKDPHGRDTILGIPKINVEERVIQEQDALELEIESFLQCVRDRSTPVVTGVDGLCALELAERIHKAFEVHGMW